MKRFVLRMCWLAASGLAVVTSLGCNGYKGFQLEPITTPPGDVLITSTSVQIPQGVAIAVRALTKGGEDPETGELFVVLQSENPAVLQVWPTTAENTFVLCGASEGTAVIRAKVDGEDDDVITAVVGPPISALGP